MTLLSSELLTLENLIDRDGLEDVLDAIAQICFEKEEHVLTNWQDSSLARSWRRNAMLIDHVKVKIHNNK